MDALKISPSLSWDKQKAAFAKMKSPPPLKDPLDKVQRACDATDWSAFGTDKLDSVAAANKRLEALEKEAKGSLKALNDRASDAEKAAKKAFDDLKKDKTSPPDASKAAEAIMKAASQLQGDITDFIDKARSAVQAELDKLTKAAAKDKKPQPGGKPVMTKEAKIIRGKILECYRKIKAPVPGARPWRFIIVKGAKTAGVAFLQTVPGNAQVTMLKKMLPGEKSPKVLKDPKGEVVWEKKSVTLVTAVSMSGVALPLQKWLKPLTGINVKVRVRKPTGEMLEEGEEGDDLSDDLLKPDAAEMAERAQAGKEFESRLRGLRDKIQKALAANRSPEDKAEIKGLVDSITAHGKAQRFDDAIDDLDSLEALLEDDSGGEGGNGADLQQLRQARIDWANSRKEAVEKINMLADAIQREFQAEQSQKAQADKAVAQVKMLAGMLKTDLETLLDKALNEKDAAARAQQAAQARRLSQQIRELLDRHPVMREIDGNEIVPNLKVIEPMKQSLSALEAALG